MSNEKLYINGNLCSLVAFAVIIRWTVSLHSYSGEKTPPLFGDYEAQRHWMEITVNLPPKQWYFNSTENDLMYWGLDYPPLSGYHSYLNGKIAELVNPEYVKLFTSRGYESYNHKFFMRATVIVSDLFVYFSSVIIFYNALNFVSRRYLELNHGEVTDSKIKTEPSQNIKIYMSHLVQIAIALLYPGIILIDHGHFQYNSISLGFTVFAVSALIYDKFLVSSFCFCLALNYKQMSLYHSLPFFIYILSHCFKFKKLKDIPECFRRLIFVSSVVVFTFLVIWYPFLSYRSLVQVVQRLFPLSRGVFEDKVANVWCAINVLYKINLHFNQVQMAKICIICVVSSSFLSLLSLFRYPTIIQFLLSLINVSLSFFLFSYQVHEKSILLVALPVMLYFPLDPLPCFWFLVISNFSMLPLYLKDNLLIPFVSLSLLFILFVFANINLEINLHKKQDKISQSFFKFNNRFFFRLLFCLSLLGCTLLFLFSAFLKPPARYPDLWPLLSSVYSCFHFGLFLLYFNYMQIFKTVV